MSPSFFNCLCEEDVRNIHLHLSDRPNHPRWFAYISSRDWTSSLHPQSPLRNVARQALSDVEVSLYNPRVESEGMSSFSRDSAKRRKLAPNDCPSTIISDDLPLKLPWNDAVVSNSDVLRQLDLSKTEDGVFVEEVLCITRGQLTVLTIDGNHHNLIASYCSGLRELWLSWTTPGPGERIWRSLRMLWRSSAPARHAEEMWRSLGPTLKVLMIDGQITDGAVGMVRRHCRQLTSIDMRKPINCGAPVQESYVDLLISFGEQLQYTDCRGMNLAQVSKVTTNCPNVRGFFEGPILLPNSGHVAKLDQLLHDNNHVRNPRENDCSSVEELVAYLYADFSAGIQALKLNVKPQLSSLKLVVDAKIAGTDVLSFVGENTGTLRTLFIECELQEKGAFVPIVTGNKWLERVQIHLWPFGDGLCTANERMVDVVDTFSRCSMLQELCVVLHSKTKIEPDIESIADAWCRFRHLGKFAPDVQVVWEEYPG